MSFLSEHLRADLDRAINGDGEMSDELVKAISDDPNLLKEWETFMQTDRIGTLIENALAEKPPCPNMGKLMPDGCPDCGVKHGIPS